MKKVTGSIPFTKDASGWLKDGQATGKISNDNMGKVADIDLGKTKEDQEGFKEEDDCK